MSGPLLSYCIYTLRLCALSIASTLLGPLMLVVLPQGVEVLRTLDDASLLGGLSGRYPDEFQRSVAFLIALGLWCLANWYGVRLLLQRDLGLPMVGQYSPAARRWRTWLPRGLVLAGALPIVAKLGALGQLAMAAAAALVAALVFAFSVYRRDIVRVLARPPRVPATARVSVAYTDPGALRADLPEGEELVLYVAAALAVVVLVALSATNYGAARGVGAASILLLSLAAIGLFLDVLLVYLPKTGGWPALTGAAVLTALVFGTLGLTANHGIAARRVQADAQTRLVRPAAREHWQRWLAANAPRGSDPIFLVAAEGGASRSAWWTGHVLSALDDATDGDFGRRVFAASGVSGGSLGLATWVSMRADAADRAWAPAHDRLAAQPPRQDECEFAARASRTARSEVMQSACFLGGDFVSTTLGYMVGVDLLQRIVPAPVSAWDRSNGLENTWRRDWRALAGSDHFGQPFMSLYAAPGAPLRTDLPVLVLNTTSVDQGRPVVQSPVQMLDPEVDDLFDPVLRTAGMSLATAVHNSARFPYVSPGGDILTTRGDYYDTVVDGGYVENSGALALAALMRAVKQPESWQELKKRLVVVFIANDPDEPVHQGAQLCDARARPLDLAPRTAWGEAATPPVGLFMVRSGRAEVSRRALLRELGLCDGSASPRVFFISMASPRVREVRPAMSWYMTPASRDTMWRAVATEPARSEMQRLVALWADSTGQAEEARRRAQERVTRLGDLP